MFDDWHNFRAVMKKCFFPEGWQKRWTPEQIGRCKAHYSRLLSPEAFGDAEARIAGLDSQIQEGLELLAKLDTMPPEELAALKNRNAALNAAYGPYVMGEREPGQDE